MVYIIQWVKLLHMSPFLLKVERSGWSQHIVVLVAVVTQGRKWSKWI